MDDIELRGVEASSPLMRRLSRSDSYTQEDKIETQWGTMLVAIQGDRQKPALFTYHDIGLNHVSNFQAFFNYIDVGMMMKNFCIYHLNAPGQDEGAAGFPDGYTFPTMDQLSEMILPVMKFYDVAHFIGFGVGAGAYILAKFGLDHATCVDGLFLINCTAGKSSWSEWGYQKVNSLYLKSSGMTASTLDYLLWHHFGKLSEERNYDMVQMYRNYFTKSIHAGNLSHFIDAFIKRGDLSITRELDPNKKKATRNFKCHVMLVAGALSPHVEDTINMNGRLDPSNSSWMKISDAGMVLEEQPTKISEALRLFLQGLGYALNSAQRRTSAASLNEALAERRRSSIAAKEAAAVAAAAAKFGRQSSVAEEDSTSDKVNITENPIETCQ